MGGEEDILVRSPFALGLLRLVRFRLRWRAVVSSTATISDAFAERQGLLDRLGQAGPNAGSFFRRSMTISMLCLMRRSSLQVVGQPHDLAVDAGADEAALEHVGEEVLVLALLPADHRRQDQEARPFRQGEDAGDDLLARLGGDGPAALGAVPLADAGVEDAQIVVDLGDGADGGARIAAGRLLLDADGRRQAAEVIDVGLLAAGRGTAGRSSTATRRSGAGPRRRACRRPANSCPNR